MKQYKEGDIIAVIPQSYHRPGEHDKTRGKIVYVNETHYGVEWNTSVGITMDYPHFDIHVHAYLISKQDVPSSNGGHMCDQHMEFAKGFRFDYYFCKVCGSKRNEA